MFFLENLVLVNRRQLLNPYRGLIGIAGMALVQAEQLQRPSKREEDDRRSKKRSEVEMPPVSYTHLKSKYFPAEREPMSI